jgi:uncharacterized membrane protein
LFVWGSSSDSWRLRNGQSNRTLSYFSKIIANTIVLIIRIQFILNNSLKKWMPTTKINKLNGKKNFKRYGEQLKRFVNYVGFFFWILFFASFRFCAVFIWRKGQTEKLEFKGADPLRKSIVYDKGSSHAQFSIFLEALESNGWFSAIVISLAITFNR